MAEKKIKDEHVSLRIDGDTHKKLVKLSASQHRTLNNMIQLILIRYVEGMK